MLGGLHWPFRGEKSPQEECPLQDKFLATPMIKAVGETIGGTPSLSLLSVPLFVFLFCILLVFDRVLNGVIC